MELHEAASVSLLFTPAGDSESASLSRPGGDRDGCIQLRHLLVGRVYNARDKQRSHGIGRLDLRGNGNLVAWRLEIHLSEHFHLDVCSISKMFYLLVWLGQGKK